MKPIAINILIAAFVSLATLAAYDRLVARQARMLGVIDTLAVFRLEEARLANLMAKEPSAEQRGNLAGQARAFAHEFPRALEQIAADCGCVVVERSAIVGTPPHMIDLTPELKKRMRL